MARDLDHSSTELWNDHAQLDDAPDNVTASGLWMPNGHDSEPGAGARSKPEYQAPIKPYVQALSPLDLDSCVRLEELTFPEHERCKREKFDYRFSKCGELSLGLFTSADTTLATANTKTHSFAVPGSAGTADTAVPIFSGTPDRKGILLGHVISTKTTNLLVRDEDMEIPSDWRTAVSSDAVTNGHVRLGHKEDGRTICVHSFAILPGFQGRGLGQLLLRAYIQRMRSSGVADRIALIAHARLVPFYESLGFESQGSSPVEFGGGGWTDLVLYLHPDDE